MERSKKAALSDCYQKFLNYIPAKAHILDAGCGTGRDAKYFSQLGYNVTAFDGSKEMVKIASGNLGRPIFQMQFQDMTFSQNYFDAVWASASLLHVPYGEFKNILQRLHQVLCPSGIFYASFKYGDSERKVKDRYFFDQNEKNIMFFLENLFQPIEIWKSKDTRSIAPSPDKLWLHVLCRRIDSITSGKTKPKVQVNNADSRCGKHCQSAL